jgi:hypothetical protein
VMKRFTTGAVSQIKNLWKILLLFYLPVILLFLSAALLSRISGHNAVAFFLRDVTVLGDLPFFAGYVSQTTLILWSALLTVCLFSLVVLRINTRDLAASKQLLLHAIILIGVLSFDDIFLFHEEIAPEYIRINEKFVYAGYLIVFIGFFALNWREILASEYFLIMLGLVMFGGSIFLDQLPLHRWGFAYFWEQLEILVEDGLKVAGIVTWLLFFARYAIQKFDEIGLKNDAPSE